MRYGVVCKHTLLVCHPLPRTPYKPPARPSDRAKSRENVCFLTCSASAHEMKSMKVFRLLRYLPWSSYHARPISDLGAV